MTIYFSRDAPELRATDYGREIWAIYESGKLYPETALSGCFARKGTPADVGSVMREIDDVIKEEAARRRHKEALDK